MSSRWPQDQRSPYATYDDSRARAGDDAPPGRDSGWPDPGQPEDPEPWAPAQGFGQSRGSAVAQAVARPQVTGRRDAAGRSSRDPGARDYQEDWDRSAGGFGDDADYEWFDYLSGGRSSQPAPASAPGRRPAGPDRDSARQKPGREQKGRRGDGRPERFRSRRGGGKPAAADARKSSGGPPGGRGRPDPDAHERTDPRLGSAAAADSAFGRPAVSGPGPAGPGPSGAAYDVDPPYDQPGPPGGYGQEGFPGAGYGEAGFAGPGPGQQAPGAGYGEAGFAGPGYGEAGFTSPWSGQPGSPEAYGQPGFSGAGYGEAGFADPGLGHPGPQGAGFGQAGFAAPGYDGAALADPGFGQPDSPGAGPSGFSGAGYGEASFAGMGFPDPGLGQRGMPGAGYDRTGFPDPGYGQPGFPDQGFGPSERTDPGFPGPGYAPAAFQDPWSGEPGPLDAGFGRPWSPDPGAGPTGWPGAPYGQPGFPDAGFGQPGFPDAGFGQPGFPDQGFGPSERTDPGLAGPGLGRAGLAGPAHGQPASRHPGSGTPGPVPHAGQGPGRVAVREPGTGGSVLAGPDDQQDDSDPRRRPERWEEVNDPRRGRAADRDVIARPSPGRGRGEPGRTPGRRFAGKQAVARKPSGAKAAVRDAPVRPSRGPAPSGKARPAPAARPKRPAVARQPRRRSAGRVVAIAGVSAMLAGTAGAAVVLTMSRGGVAHVVTPPAKLGAYLQDPELATQMQAKTLQQQVVTEGAGHARNVIYAVYEDTTGPAAVSGPQIILFIGGNLSGSSAGSFISTFTAKLPGTVTTSPGSLGGEAACVPALNGHPAACIWADNDTFGVVTSATLSASGLANEMRQMRPMVERPASQGN